MNHLLLLEDDAALIDGLRYSLPKNGFTLDVVSTVRDALKALNPGHPYDLLLLDVTLPDGSGFSVCERVRQAKDHTPILFLAASDEETSIIYGLDGGGDDYMTKHFRLGELCSRIRALLRRSSPAFDSNPPGASGLSSGPVFIDTLSGKVRVNGQAVELTGMEYRLLCLFVSRPGQLLSRSFLLDALWDGNGNFVDDNTLSVYIRRLREKVEADPSSPRRLVTVRGLGYRWEEKEEVL